MPDISKLHLSGDCGIRAIRSLHNEIVSALDAAAVLEIDCADAEHIDLSFAQVMTSAAQTAGRRAKQIRLVNLSEAGRLAFTRAGLRPHDSHPFAS